MRKLFVLFTILFCAVFAAQAAAEESADQSQTYVVERGDRFETLAEHFGVTPGEIRAANPRRFGITCGNPYTRERRDGSRRAHCGQPSYYLIAGVTLTIPKARILLESENVELGSEIVALQVEFNRAERERDALSAERDGLDLEIEATLLEMAELQARYDELKRAGARSPASAGGESNEANQTPSVAKDQESFLGEYRWPVVGLLCVLIVLFIVVLYRRYRRFTNAYEKKSERDDAALGREREDFKATRKIAVREDQDLSERRRQLDDDEQEIRAQRLAIERDQESLRKQREELGRWEESLKAREAAPASEKPRVATAIGVPPVFLPVMYARWRQLLNEEMARLETTRQRLAEEGRTLAGREAACTAHEKSVERRAAALTALQEGLSIREKELAGKEHGVEELRKTFSSGKARCDLKDIDQEQREENLVKGFADLAVQQERLQKELDARRDELDRLADEINGKIRMYDEDIATAIKQARDEVAGREVELARREREIIPRETAVAAREEASDKHEKDYELRLQELERFHGQLDSRAEQLAFGEAAVLEREGELENNREAFANEVREAKNILSRAKRKKAAVEALEGREAALGDRDLALQRREERERILDGVPKSKLPRRPTVVPGSHAPSPPVNGVGDGLDGAGDDSSTAVVLPELPEGDVDPSATTYVDAPGSEPAMDVSKCLCPVCNHEVLFGKLDEHLAQAHPGQDASHDSHQTEPHIPVAEKSTPHSESSFWCTLCQKDIPMDDMEAHYKLHREQGKPGPLGQG